MSSSSDAQKFVFVPSAHSFSDSVPMDLGTEDFVMVDQKSSDEELTGGSVKRSRKQRRKESMTSVTSKITAKWADESIQSALQQLHDLEKSGSQPSTGASDMKQGSREVQQWASLKDATTLDASGSKQGGELLFVRPQLKGPSPAEALVRVNKNQDEELYHFVNVPTPGLEGLVLTPAAATLARMLHVWEMEKLLSPFKDVPMENPADKQSQLEELLEFYVRRKNMIRDKQIWKGSEKTQDPDILPWVCTECNQPKPQRMGRCLFCNVDSPGALKTLQEAPKLTTKRGEWQLVLGDDLTVDWKLVGDASGSTSRQPSGSEELLKDWVQHSAIEVGSLASTPPRANLIDTNLQGACEIPAVREAMHNTALSAEAGEAVAFHPATMQALEIMEDFRRLQPVEAERGDSVPKASPPRPESAAQHFASLPGAADFLDIQGALQEESSENTFIQLTPAAKELRSLTVEELCSMYFDPDKTVGGKVLAAAVVQQEVRRQDWDHFREESRKFLQSYVPSAEPQQFWSDTLRRAIESGDLNPRAALTPLSLDLLVAAHKDYIQSAQMLQPHVRYSVFGDKLFQEVPDSKSSPGMAGEMNNMQRIRWLLTTHKGEWKMVSSQWVLVPGSVEVSGWMENQHWPPITQASFLDLEKRTWNRKVTLSRNELQVPPDLSKKEIEDEIAADLRPSLKRMLNPVLAVYEKDLDNWHYERHVTSWTLPGLFSHFGQHHTAKELWAYWESLPTLKEAHIRGKKSTLQKEERRRQYEEVKRQAADFCTKHGIVPPTTPEERSKLIRHVSQFLGATRFLTKNPDFVMELPVVAGHDTKDQLQWRCMFDERLSFPIDALPIDIQSFFTAGGKKWAVAEQYWRCNSTIWWTQGPPPDASGSSGGVQVTLLKEADTTHDPNAGRPSHIPVETGTVDCKTAKGQKVWMKADCGMILSARSQWRMTIRSKNNKNGTYGWACAYCTQNWSRKRDGSRFVVIYDGEVALQLILDEPPEALWNAWIKERCEFYKRLEPRDDMRDVAPMLPQAPSSNRIKLMGPASDAVWKVLYSNPEVEALLEVDRLARTALRVEGSLFVHS
jgi:hypothetical protein